jgi:hypothetical protein
MLAAKPTLASARRRTFVLLVCAAAAIASMVTGEIRVGQSVSNDFHP